MRARTAAAVAGVPASGGGHCSPPSSAASLTAGLANISCRLLPPIACHVCLPLLSSELTSALEQQHSNTFFEKELLSSLISLISNGKTNMGRALYLHDSSRQTRGFAHKL